MRAVRIAGHVRGGRRSTEAGRGVAWVGREGQGLARAGGQARPRGGRLFGRALVAWWAGRFIGWARGSSAGQGSTRRGRSVDGCSGERVPPGHLDRRHGACSRSVRGGARPRILGVEPLGKDGCRLAATAAFGPPCEPSTRQFPAPAHLIEGCGSGDAAAGGAGAWAVMATSMPAWQRCPPGRR